MPTTPADLPGVLASVPVEAVITGLQYLLLTTVLSSFLIPTAVVLFVFSTPVLRRQPIFILNVCAIGLGLIQGMVYMYVTVSGCTSFSFPRTEWPPGLAADQRTCSRAAKSDCNIGHHRLLHHRSHMRPDHSFLPGPCCVPATTASAARPDGDLWPNTCHEGRADRKCVLPNLRGPAKDQQHSRRCCQSIRCDMVFAIRQVGIVPSAHRRCVCAIPSFRVGSLTLTDIIVRYASTLFLLKIHPGVKNEYRAPVSRGLPA